ncbi:DHA2 family efflux MFS transporter permease subunit [Streptomyces sp. NBC_00859]|uniref:DHA2 family efflux MFS transporter permease subunit n=1 Tax=Streptomyces sp. NBC_00859 TaxID=2903682 RepID=UPI00386831D8|nr:DHA2 family efflux MFS transporter permease subunit [Streptomyces sp. NBC_00859]
MSGPPSTAEPQEVGAARHGLRGHPWLTVMTLSVGAMMVSLDTTIVTVAQPAMQADLHTDLTGVQWVTDAYLLAVAALLITAGRLGDRFGHRMMFLVGACGFTASSFAIGMSSSLGWVVAMRVVQGVFGALMQPATLGLLRGAFPPDRLNQPIAVRSAVIAASTAAGPVVGGLLVEHAHWSWVFFLNIPLGALALVLGITVLGDVRDGAAGGRLDLVGMLLVAGALGSLVWGLSVAADSRRSSLEALPYLVAGAVLGAVFVAWERRSTHPLVPLRLFRSAPFTSGVVTMAVMGCVMVGAPFVLIFYLQNVLALSAAESGVRVLGLTLLMIVGAPPAAIWIGKAGPRIPVAVGLTVIAASMCALAGLDADSGTLHTTLCFLLLGLGFSPVMVGGTKLVISNVPKELSGVAGGMQQTAMQVGGSLGIAVVSAVVMTYTAARLPSRLSAAGVTLPSDRTEQAVRSVAVGLPPGLTGPAAPGVLERVGQSVFLDAMQYSLLATAAVAALGAVVVARARQD